MDSFLRLVEQQYGVAPKALQGGARELKEINDWVAQQTGRKVQRILAKPLPRNTGVNTISAAFFNGASQTRLLTQTLRASLISLRRRL